MNRHPDYAAIWGEDDPDREYFQAARKGMAALNRLQERRDQRMAEYRRQQALEAIEAERVWHAARMRDYRARKKAARLALQKERP